jgi:aspartate-semialdehyde dehydrogenase
VVVSALGGVTDDLIAAAETATAGNDEFQEQILALDRRHRKTAAAVAAADELAEIERSLDVVLDELANLLHGAALVGECTARTMDSVLSCGERLSAMLAAAALRKSGVEATACDARRLIVTDSSFGNARVDLEDSSSRIKEHFSSAEGLQVVTGFIAANPEGDTTTLGRGGSDYTAALLGAALGADCVEIWTDVDGVMSADPRQVPDAFSLPSLSYDELMELSHFGAKVVYPPTLHPARSHSIPIVIRNTLNPDFEGTRVVERGTANGKAVRGISSIDEVALLRLEGDGMVGVPGIAKRLFGALAREGISVILISQASSEHSICFAVEPGSVDAASREVNAEFKLERQVGLIDDLVVDRGFSVIAVVGEGMCRIPGIAGKVFSVLGRHGVNVRAIAQGSSELNISLVVAREEQGSALLAIHETFFGEAERVELVGERIPTAVLGATGSVGQRLISLLANHPWFKIAELTASERSAGRAYRDATRWLQSTPIPAETAEQEVLLSDSTLSSPLVLSALDAAVAGPIEEKLAGSGHLVVSNASSHRMRPDVPLLVPEVNPDHLRLIGSQPYDGGAIVTNPNCSTIGLVLALAPLHSAFGLESVHVVTMQAASGAGYPGVSSLELVDNVVPYIGGEEAKMEAETLKILGALSDDGVADADLVVSAQCNRVPVLDGHTECVSVKLRKRTTIEEIVEAWQGFKADPQWLELPTAPPQPIIYDDAENAPQPRLHRDAGGGMAVTIGRLRPCPLLDFKFVVLSHNTIRGAAGGALLAAELAVAKRVIQGLEPPHFDGH